MNLKEALKSLIDFEVANDDLFDKVLTDHSLTASDTYLSSHRDEIDMCLVDVYNYLAAHPEIRDGQSSVKFDPAHLRASAQAIMARYPDASTASKIARGYGGKIKTESIW